MVKRGMDGERRGWRVLGVERRVGDSVGLKRGWRKGEV